MSKEPRKGEIYMGIPAHLPPLEISYEEQRVRDYIQAYRTSGRPPQPVPPTPTSASERLALGLPPLFEPHTESAITITIPAPVTGRKNLNELPEVQVFAPAKWEGETAGVVLECQTIVMQKEFYHFSPEELRYHAYRSGKKSVPQAALPVISATIVESPTAATPIASISQTNSDSPLTNGTASEDYQSISCRASYSRHSFEELRVAYLLLGREATSDEITSQNSLLRLTV